MRMDPREGTKQMGLYITTDGDPFYLELAGDCCSESWWSDIVNPENVIGAKVLSVTTSDEAVTDERTRQEHDDCTAYTVTTERGVALFKWRNSSNGYYSGWLVSERTVPDTILEWPLVTETQAW